MEAFRLNHVAVLVRSVEESARKLTGFTLGPAQDWPGEGTREIYVGDVDSQSALLLLMEPTRPGSYQRALEKRGPGLHHIAIDVTTLDLNHFTLAGWILHKQDSKTAWLRYPGFPALIEIQERSDRTGPPLITSLELPSGFERLIAALGVPSIRTSDTTEIRMSALGRHLRVSDLTEPAKF